MELMDIKTYAGIIILLVWAVLFALVGLACKNIKVNPLKDIKDFFNKQSPLGRIVSLLFFLMMTIYGGTKPSGSGGSTNDVDNVSNSSSATNNSNSIAQIQSGQISSSAQFGSLSSSVQSSNSNTASDGSNEQSQINIPAYFTNEDFERGFVLTSIKTDEDFDFSPPETGAIICNDWRKFGAATDWMYITMTNWAFNVGTNNVNTLRVFSFGKVEPLVFEEENIPSTGYWFAPFLAQLGVVPEANEELLLEASRPSQVWYRITPYNSLIITWQNALLERDTNKPVSFQVEFNPDGLFTYRYDLSNLDSDSITNIVAGASFAGNTWATNSLSSGVTSMTFYQLSEEDSIDSDPDGDGIVTIVELYLYGTNPHRIDSDFDGLNDYEELFVYETNPNNANSLSSDYYDGLAAKLGDLNPLSYQGGSTNTVLEHIFYTGSTNGVILLPTSSELTGVLKVTVSGEGTGKLVIDDTVVPLIGAPRTRNAATSNTLLVSVGKGKKKSIWLSKPDGLEVALDSDDFFIGELPTLYWPHGWIAFPHTEATHPCIHEIAKKEMTVSLVHGEEFPDLTATWVGGQNVTVTNMPPVSATLYAEFERNQSRFVSYEVNHPNQLNIVKPTFQQEFRYCPPLDVYDDDDEELSNFDYESDDIIDPIDYECFCEDYGHCNCTDEVCNCPDFWCSCDASRYPTLDEDESPQSYTNLLNNVTPLPNVLYLYRDNTDTMSLEVPEGTPRKCCPCKEHWASNYVAKVSHSARITVTDSNGENFDISYEPCIVNVYGQRPSREFGDTSLLFVTNAIPYKQIDYTVLGVTFETPDGYAQISEYKSLDTSFGYPATVSTNIETATSLYIKTNVLLTNGIVKISLENATNDFSIWLPEWDDENGCTHPAEMLLQNNVINERYYSLEKWSKLSKKMGHSKRLKLKIFSSKESHARIKFELISSDGTHYVRDYDTLNVTTILPPLRFDITRDGSIDENDIAATLEGRDFYYWLNEDGISSSLTFTPNIDDLIINGTPDLINFFPVAIDLQPFMNSWRGRVTYRIKPSNGRTFINYCFSNLGWNIAGYIQKYNTRTITINNNTPSYNNIFDSELKSLTWRGIDLPESLYFNFPYNSGMMICEATDIYDTLKIEVLQDDYLLYSYTAPMKILRVKDMYSWLNFRSVSDENIGRPSIVNSLNGENYDKNLLFFHGANIDNEAAENWGDTIFKRFWVAGIKANFYNVDWRSDIGTPANYHQNVSNSFVVAQRIAPSIKAIAEEKDTVVMAHSLGNMVVSSMIQDYELEVSKYIMVNSAVPVEAYDASLSLRSPYLVHSEWEEYPTNSWASSWHTLFTEFENDDRKYLGWPNRFVNVASNVVNFYSSGDEVLELANHNNVNIFTGIGFVETLSHHSWHKQELFKGRGYDILWGFTDWAGWDIRENIFGVNAISVSQALDMEREDFRTNIVFNCYPESMNTNVIDMVTRNSFLAYGIPALTPAAGATPFGSKEDFVIKMFNLDTDEFKSNGWVTREKYGGRWLHSDFKDVPYIFTYKFYDKVLEKGNLK